MAKRNPNNDWRALFKKWYVSFAFIVLSLSVIFRILGDLGFGWVKAMEKAVWVYFDVAFLLAFILLGIFIYFPKRKQKNPASPKLRLDDIKKELKSINKSIAEINEKLDAKNMKRR